ncbi:uncharacterized protein BDZ83DRAFT_609710 [Colletotrichum acutatum]|uniref:Uncharacterized protein n=1 Tax=Glomerella acutata TaxID=27357 RepID=A0AAD8UWD1_GLOAC|nr:uncharacterized protein BDZ83DRAFT_609710 [Colletotrichum acutatum]KAK1728259.1 hypothetical protein BDZ83DRAFT_609710 [Colletotrichum acutatum]
MRMGRLSFRRVSVPVVPRLLQALSLLFLFILRFSMQMLRLEAVANLLECAASASCQPFKVSGTRQREREREMLEEVCYIRWAAIHPIGKCWSLHTPQAGSSGKARTGAREVAVGEERNLGPCRGEAPAPRTSARGTREREKQEERDESEQDRNEAVLGSVGPAD